MKDFKRKIEVAVGIGSVISTAWSLGSTAKEKYDERTLYTARVSSQAYVYNILMEWLDGNISPKHVRFESESTGIRRFYDANRRSQIVIDGYSVSVVLSRAQATPNEDENSLFAAKIPQEEAVFTCRDPRGIDALQRLLAQLTEEANLRRRKIYVHTVTKYGWASKELPSRPLDSVILPAGVKEDLVSDLDRFFASEDHYIRIGAPWHRGYMLYGPPGNGKSSLGLAIANKYRMNLYNMPLSAVTDDERLASSISDMTENSILLLEDIDIFSKSLGREQADSGPTLAGLLNALDGVSTPHGMVTFIMTNNPESLDPALVRNGRVDYRLELRKPDPHQISTMFERVYEEPLGVEPRHFESMAELANVLKCNIMDAEAARLEIKD